MKHAWRLDKAKRTQAESFSGDGAQISGGRWNHKGVRAVYASETLALAALEKFVHTQGEGRNISLVSYRIEIPETMAVDRFTISQLPLNWRQEPAPRQTQDLGSGWLKKRTKAALMVPSVIVPSEYNLVFNPEHPDFAKIRIIPGEAFGFDSRMWK